MTNAEISKLSFSERQKLLKERLGGKIAKMYEIDDPNKKVESIISQIPPIEPLKNKQKKVVGGTPQKQEITKGEEKNWIIRLDVSTAFLIEIETISRKKGLSKQGYILKILEEIIEKNASGQQSFLLKI